MYVNHEVFNDADRHAAALRGWDQRYDQLGSGVFQSTVKQVAVEGVQVFQEAANVRVVQRGELPAGYTTFGLALGGSAPFSFRGVKLDQDAMVITSGAKEFMLHSPADMSLSASRSIRACCGWSPMPPASTSRTISSSATSSTFRARPACAWAGASSRRWSARSRGRTSLPIRRASAASRRTVAEGILDLITYHVPDQTNRLTHACQSDIVRRSHELLLQRPEEPGVDARLCSALRVSRRTIQNSFQSITQTNPATYLRSVRLVQVRRLLLTTHPNEVPVSEAAARWGFTHLGHFASDYKTQFGELPSQTARRP